MVVVEALESYEVLRDRAGWEVGGLIDGFSVKGSDVLSAGFSLKLNRLLVLVDIGLIMAGDMLFLRKSR